MITENRTVSVFYYSQFRSNYPDLNDSAGNANNKSINLKIHNKIKPKDQIIKRGIKPYNQMNIFNINYTGTNTNTNTSFTDEEIPNNKAISKDKYKNIYNKKEKNIFQEVMEKCKKKELKNIKLCQIDKNMNTKNTIIEPIKSNYRKIYEKINYNPITINFINNDYDDNKKEKVILGSKYTINEASQDNISKKKLYNKLNQYFKGINKRKISVNRNKINLNKMDLYKLRLKKYHDNKIQKYKELIEESIKDVLGVKNNCMNWVNELKLKNNDLYKDFDL